MRTINNRASGFVWEHDENRRVCNNVEESASLHWLCSRSFLLGEITTEKPQDVCSSNTTPCGSVFLFLNQLVKDNKTCDSSVYDHDLCCVPPLPNTFSTSHHSHFQAVLLFAVAPTFERVPLAVGLQNTPSSSDHLSFFLVLVWWSSGKLSCFEFDLGCKSSLQLSTSSFSISPS